ncbi:type II secretion system major pseudopilin GspG [Uliginosibacterium sp. H3]|uniref:Type II secretion system core protein G n=1 Tax=Uliginosibacterium silvisoli TaxID=3114758 RepID=A0ABU6K4C3_9RHOO|nr:type II secretion system major pseudopilin GspG [Uliginosibacterium sp. H3]
MTTRTVRHRRDTAHRIAGFTLLELLVVMVIIGLLAGYVGPKFFAHIGKAEVKTARAQLDSLEKALDAYRLDVGSYPTTEQGLASLVTAPGDVPQWKGPYLKKGVPEDPWHHPYQYKAPGEHGEFDLLSLGKDGQPGGTGEAEDIVNW